MTYPSENLNSSIIIHAGTGAVVGFTYGVIKNFVDPYYEKKLAEEDLALALRGYSRASGCNEGFTDAEYQQVLSVKERTDEIKPDWMKVILLKIKNTQTDNEEESDLQGVLVKKIL